MILKHFLYGTLHDPQWPLWKVALSGAKSQIILPAAVTGEKRDRQNDRKIHREKASKLPPFKQHVSSTRGYFRHVCYEAMKGHWHCEEVSDSPASRQWNQVRIWRNKPYPNTDKLSGCKCSIALYPLIHRSASQDPSVDA